MICTTDNAQNQTNLTFTDTQTVKKEAIYESNEIPTNKEPYVLTLNAMEMENANYAFEIQVELNNGAHFVSPNAKRDFKGKFVVKIDDNDKIEEEGLLIETPLSKEEYDSHPFVDGNVNWVRVNTTYKQLIKRASNEDFQVMGHIQFTIEPRCSLEKVAFIIKYENGEMKFELFDC